jgi:hypothetical protein
VPIVELRVRNYRAFEDSGCVSLGSVSPITGRNDTGKSGLLHALQRFFNPPKKGGLAQAEIHGLSPNTNAEIEVAFRPSALTSQEVQFDAKNKIHLVDDYLVDGRGFLRLRLTMSTKEIVGVHALIKDVCDDTLFPLATKGHDQLLELLAGMGLPAIRAGKETNQEKRDALRKKSLELGKGFKEDWVDVSEVEGKLREILPKFLLFADTADYSIEETAVQNQFKGIVDRALAGHTGAKQIEDDIRVTIQQEFDKVFERLSHLTDTVTSLSAQAKVSWKKAVDGIGLSWGDASGMSIPYEMRGAGVRRLFMLAYLQYEAAYSLLDPNGPKYVFAIEEPEVHLHPGAQRDLIVSFRELADLGHALVFTTHSPVFASAARIQDIVLVVRSGIKSEAKQAPAVDAQSIAKELGVEASDRLVGKNHVILVEGARDVDFYTSVLNELHGSNLTKLDPNKVLFLQCGGIPNVKFMVTMRCMDEADLKWAVLADSDRYLAGGPMGPQAVALDAACPPSCLHRHFLERTAIENYLDPAMVLAVSNVDCRIPKYGKPTDATGAPLNKSDLKRVKDSCAEVARRMGAAGISACSQDQNGACEFIRVFDGIHAAFGL